MIPPLGYAWGRGCGQVVPPSQPDASYAPKASTHSFPSLSATPTMASSSRSLSANPTRLEPSVLTPVMPDTSFVRNIHLAIGAMLSGNYTHAWPKYSSRLYEWDCSDIDMRKAFNSKATNWLRDYRQWPPVIRGAVGEVARGQERDQALVRARKHIVPRPAPMDLSRTLDILPTISRPPAQEGYHRH
ncbi:hypothetical protein Salat_2138900 [Sesamum alatum]|uniref:Uncharacterized protein n=1 Tax=Sesamum alatum TaxID=300844 RepID=A0AAE1Y193_9LAMI|nr:hypothetical protein Salat_2138900 [Sesamum alatum]